MRNPTSFKEQRGFMTFAQNNDETDYLSLAYCQALSIKCSQREVTSYAVAVDAATKEKITDKHRRIFDYIIDIEDDAATRDKWKLKNEWQAWWLTPFKETIKIESDILFSTNIDHWWTGLRQTEVCLTSQVRDYEGNLSTSRAYRKLFDDNLLPDVYNGLMYFRFGHISRDFFIYARYVFENWDQFKNDLLKNCRDDEPTTDVAFAIAAEMLGVEKCTNPALSFPSFTHMKGNIQGWGINTDWTEKLYSQVDDNLNLTVGFSRQQHPFHYQQKKFMTNEIIQKYEKAYEKSHN
jgi:hypothetical protein